MAPEELTEYIFLCFCVFVCDIDRDALLVATEVVARVCATQGMVGPEVCIF